MDGVIGAMRVNAFAIQEQETHPLAYNKEWELNSDRADELRPVGHNPCNGDASNSIATCALPREFMPP